MMGKSTLGDRRIRLGMRVENENGCIVIHSNVINQWIFSTEIVVQDISIDRWNATVGAMHI
jgi:hypothetical protein